ncbi:MAG: GIY-YIG nuclease family protein [Clostridiales bacterium]|nr:GIY-YIG nuclease family protein [Clostridiales bacterium]
MKTDRRKQLQEEYKNRKPDMGVIAFECRATGDSYLMASEDIKASFNRARLQLNIGRHPMAKLQSQWNQYGEEGFDLIVHEQLPYEQLDEVKKEDLEALLQLCLEKVAQSSRM